MSASRERILEAIRGALARRPLTPDAAARLEHDLVHPRANIIPERGRPDPARRLAQFAAEAERSNTTTARLASAGEVPGAAAAYLRAERLPLVLRLAPDPLLAEMPWADEADLAVSSGPARADDPVAVTGAFAGIAETGTLMLLSGPHSPTLLNFLPETHIAVVAAERIVGSYEDAFSRLRSERGGAMPRVVNWITGPSRTADIEQTLLLGAHGPKRLHILIVDGLS